MTRHQARSTTTLTIAVRGILSDPRCGIGTERRLSDKHGGSSAATARYHQQCVAAGCDDGPATQPTPSDQPPGVTPRIRPARRASLHCGQWATTDQHPGPRPVSAGVVQSGQLQDQKIALCPYFSG